MQRRTRTALLLVVFSLFAIAGCNRSSPQVQSVAATPDPRLTEAHRLEDRHDWVGAIDRARSVLLVEPDHQEALRLIARCEVQRLRQQSQPWQAAVRLQDLIRSQPNDTATLKLAAELFEQLGLRHDANEALRQLILREPLTPTQLRSLLLPGGAFAAAETSVPAGDPAAATSVLSLNQIRELAADRRISEAQSLLSEATALAQSHPAAMALQGQLLLQAQQYPSLSQWLTTADPSWQRYPEFWIAVGGLARHESQNDLAIAAFAQAIRREPMDRAALGGLGAAIEATGDGATAKRLQDRAALIKELQELSADIVAHPTIATAAFESLADGLCKLGQHAQAYNWQLLGQQRLGMLGGQVRDDPRRRQQMLEQYDPDQPARDALAGLRLDNAALNLQRLAVAQDVATKPPAAASMSAVAPIAPVFADVASDCQLNFQYRNADPVVPRHFLLHQALGAGIAALDYDLDGNVDLFVGQGSCNPPNAMATSPDLLARQLDGRFTDVTVVSGCDDAGYTLGVTAGDWNQDGFADLAVASMGRNRLWINQGDGTFAVPGSDPFTDREPGSAATSSQGSPYTNGLAIADVSGDHLPDLIEINYTDDARIFDPIQFHPDGSPVRLPGPLQFIPASDHVYVARGDGAASRVVLRSETGPMRRYGMGLLITDFDGDSQNEIFVANDQSGNNFWQITPQSTTDHSLSTAGSSAWVDMAAAAGLAYGGTGTPLACMGIAAADFDHNGLLDLHVTNFQDEWSNLYLQRGGGMFVDLAVPYGIDAVSDGLLGFGTQALDYDNNTSVDLVVGNGHIEDFRDRGQAFQMPTQVLTLLDDRFQQQLVSGDSSYWDTGHLTRALVKLDWNRDGRLDFVVSDLQQPLALLQNNTPTPHHWLQLQLVGTRSERDAIGTRVSVVDASGITHTASLQTGDGYMCRNEAVLHFGLAAAAAVDQLTVRWPSGLVQHWNDCSVDARWLIVEAGEAMYRLSDDRGE